jgi:hypothetical protein
VTVDRFLARVLDRGAHTRAELYGYHHAHADVMVEKVFDADTERADDPGPPVPTLGVSRGSPLTFSK